MRRQITVIVAPINGRMAVHFTRTKLQGDDLWFPVGCLNLFMEVEALMVVNGLAHNVTDIEKVRECGASVDYLVTYNAREESDA